MIRKNSAFMLSNFLQFSPYILFLSIYILLFLYSLYTKKTCNALSATLSVLPLFAASIAALYSFFTFQETLTIDKKVAIFLSGASNITSINFYFSLIYIAIFNHMMAKTNGTLMAITLSIVYIPTIILLPIIFLIALLISILMASPFIASIMLIPIGYGIGLSLHYNNALMIATIISGSLCGQHILLYFPPHNIYKKFDIKLLLRTIYKSAFPIIIAIVGTLLILSQYNYQPIPNNIIACLQASLHWSDYITVIPYLFLLSAHFFAINIIANIVIASFMAFAIEIIVHKIIFLDAITKFFDGFYTTNIIGNIILLHITISGLIKIIEYNKGFDWILETIRTNKQAQDISSIIKYITALILIDTLSVNIMTPLFIEKKTDYQTLHEKVGCLSDLITTTYTILLPYGSIMLFALHNNKCVYFDTMQYMIYPLLVIMIACIELIHIYNQKKKIEILTFNKK